MFFAIRNDSDALFANYKIAVACTRDVQLMELAKRTYPRDFVAGLAKCLSTDSKLSAKDQYDWEQAKKRGKEALQPPQRRNV